MDQGGIVDPGRTSPERLLRDAVRSNRILHESLVTEAQAVNQSHHTHSTAYEREEAASWAGRPGANALQPQIITQRAGGSGLTLREFLAESNRATERRLALESDPSHPTPDPNSLTPSSNPQRAPSLSLRHVDDATNNSRQRLSRRALEFRGNPPVPQWVWQESIGTQSGSNTRPAADSTGSGSPQQHVNQMLGSLRRLGRDNTEWDTRRLERVITDTRRALEGLERIYAPQLHQDRSRYTMVLEDGLGEAPSNLESNEEGGVETPTRPSYGRDVLGQNIVDRAVALSHYQRSRAADLADASETDAEGPELRRAAPPDITSPRSLPRVRDRDGADRLISTPETHTPRVSLTYRDAWAMLDTGVATGEDRGILQRDIQYHIDRLRVQDYERNEQHRFLPCEDDAESQHDDVI
ncbi:MAG: hypothetical protein M1833_001540 [Piccolia ochrophora]|nr:MAG: hypothetical protein M1833_001540 [Piccolia ochrophora]